MKRTTMFSSLMISMLIAGTLTAAPVEPITVTVFPFDTKATGQEDLGEQISQLVEAHLSQADQIKLLDRKYLEKMLREQELNLTGMVDTDSAIKVGKLVGARIMVMGKAFQLGQSIFMTAKILGTETSLVQMVSVKGKTDRDMGEMVFELAEKVLQTYQEKATSLVAESKPQPTFDVYKKQLQGKTLPSVVVAVPEEHIAAVRPAQADPAVETEIKKILLDCGLTVYDVDTNKLTAHLKRSKMRNWPDDAAKADWIIAGEAFSEFGARIGNLNSCSARVELNVIDAKTGKLVMSDREMTRAVDLGENLAGRKALQLAAQRISMRLLEKIQQHAK